MPFDPRSVDISGIEELCRKFLLEGIMPQANCSRPLSLRKYGCSSTRGTSDARCLFIFGTYEPLLVTSDTLRYDVAKDALARGQTPNLGRVRPGGQGEERHSPGTPPMPCISIFAGFFPTPAAPGQHPRLFAAQFPAARRPRTNLCASMRPTS